MAFWERAKKFISDIFYEEQPEPQPVQISIERRDTANGRDIPVTALPGQQPAGGYDSKNNFDYGLDNDFFTGVKESPYALPSLSEEDKEFERSRISSICYRIADANGLGEPVVWTVTSGSTRLKGDFTGKEKGVDNIIFNAAYTKTLSDDEVAFIAGRQFARIYCMHDEEEKLLSRSFQRAQIPQEYRFMLYGALLRKNVFEEDRVGMLFMEQAGFSMPKDIGFLHGDKSGFGVPTKNIDMLSAEPQLAIRQLVLDDVKGIPGEIDKKGYSDYINLLEKIVKEQEKFIADNIYRDGVYYGLNIPQEEWVSGNAYKVEKEVLSHVMPVLEKEHVLLKERYENFSLGSNRQTALKKIRPMRDIDIPVKDMPEREKFVKAAADVVQFMQNKVLALNKIAGLYNRYPARTEGQKIEPFRYLVKKKQARQRGDNNVLQGNTIDSGR